MVISNFTEEWEETLRQWHLEFFFIPTTVITLATLLANPVLLTCIFLSRALRQENRYLLVANTLTADMIFVLSNLVTVILNAVKTQLTWLVCELLTAVTVATYSCAILTVTLMVGDTYAAVRWPLRYRDIFPPARTYCILVCVWVISAIYPVTVVIQMELESRIHQEKVALCLVLISLGFIQAEKRVGVHIYLLVAALICAVLIFYCYIRLYMETRIQGIWQNRFSRARVTLLAHSTLLLLYFAPGFVFILELFLFPREDIKDVHVWISVVNMCFFMLLPRAFAPYLYGLRYRELSDSLVLLLKRHRVPNQITVS
ncbi:putative G-protein coupled receptor 148 [Pholidichthys leucotaenia]